ncbi:rab11 family-interacting protein 4A-like [Sinocyclocheilus grahami]|uniref:rab11 family-interacting protein 4A-like n=1 Tax=Sinocyclocheilus grahami TaxID=75366 RepID=UPI0007AD431C|nr:PREDICTED: rab11 family-interacting protein 4A-like [Sinocyclocheilus grahami]
MLRNMWEKQRMTDKLEDTSLRLKDEMDLYRKMMDKLWQNRHEFQKEREAMQELIEDLRRELEHLQLFKLEAEKPGRGRNAAGLSEYNAKTREIELEHEVKRLKQENHKFRDQNDDLNGQILSLSLYEAKNLFACQTKAQSLAAEIDNASRDELVEALKEQEEINFRLRQYMDKIILAILDHLALSSFIMALVEALKEQEEINFRLRQYMDKIILAILDHNPSILEIKH